MVNRQMNTAMAGIIPSPKDMRQTARRWCSPKLRRSSTSKSEAMVKKCGERLHPKEHKGYEGRDYEAEVDHRVWDRILWILGCEETDKLRTCSQCKPSMLRVLRDGGFFGLFGC